MGVRTLAIGDGANDVSMIQTADVGIGMYFPLFNYILFIVYNNKYNFMDFQASLVKKECKQSWLQILLYRDSNS